MAGEGCGAVVLAAGEARRFGSPKMLMPFGESTIIGAVVHALTRVGIAPIIVVAGANFDDIKKALVEQPVEVVRNPNPGGEMISSIKIGVKALPDSLDRFIIALGDQPRIKPEGLSHLIEEQTGSGKGIAIPTYEGKRGHPVVFGSSYLKEIPTLGNEQTLRDLIETHHSDIVEIGCDSDAYVRDIDTREEYEHELERWHAEQ